MTLIDFAFNRREQFGYNESKNTIQEEWQRHQSLPLSSVQRENTSATVFLETSRFELSSIDCT